MLTNPSIRQYTDTCSQTQVSGSTQIHAHKPKYQAVHRYMLTKPTYWAVHEYWAHKPNILGCTKLHAHKPNVLCNTCSQTQVSGSTQIHTCSQTQHIRPQRTKQVPQTPENEASTHKPQRTKQVHTNPRE